MTDITVSLGPPHFDEDYASLGVRHPKRGGKRAVESRDDAVETAKATLKRWGERDDNDFQPTPDNTTLELHPDYEGELSVRELFGDATLAEFGAGAVESRYSEAPWYTHQPEYDEWLRPVLEGSSKAVLEVTCVRRNRVVTRWVRRTTGPDGEPDLEELRYQHDSHRLQGPEPANRTKLVRAIGAYGLVYPEPHSVSFQEPSETGFTGAIDYLGEFPAEVNGWTFYPDDTGAGDFWLGEGTTNGVRVFHGSATGGARFVLEDITIQFGERRITPDAVPESRADSQLTTMEAREQAVEWMEEHPPEMWLHPEADDDGVTA